jgi:hypothetical protein
MPLDKKKTKKNLKKKGFFENPSKNHIHYTYFTLSGIKSSITTKISHSIKDKDISDDLISCMAHDCRITNQEFKDLANCPLSQENYEKTVFDKI